MLVVQKEYKIAPKVLIDIIWNDDIHVLKTMYVTITFTAMEYRMLSSLRDGHPVSYAMLACFMYNRKLDRKTHEMLFKLIDKIRGKLRGTGVYIYCIIGYGYFLLPEIQPNQDL